MVTPVNKDDTQIGKQIDLIVSGDDDKLSTFFGSNDDDDVTQLDTFILEEKCKLNTQYLNLKANKLIWIKKGAKIKAKNMKDFVTSSYIGNGWFKPTPNVTNKENYLELNRRTNGEVISMEYEDAK